MSKNEQDGMRLLGETSVKMAAGAAAGAAGSIIGLLIAGPPGAVGGAIVGNASVPLLEQLGLQFRGMFGAREKRRVITILDSATSQIRKNKESGKLLRADGFLALESPDYSAAEEICESVIRKAQAEYEERKIKYQGVLLGNLPFASEIDRAQANLLVRLAFELSYRQYCLLSLFNQLDKYSVEFKYSTELPNDPKISGTVADLPRDQREAYEIYQEEYRKAAEARRQEAQCAREQLTSAHASVRRESYDLYARNLIKLGFSEAEGKLVAPMYFGYEEVRIPPIGKMLFELMGLREIEHHELEYLSVLMQTDYQYN